MEESSHIEKASAGHVSPFERIRRTNEAGVEYWSSRDFAAVLDYGDYRNFEAVIEKAKLACFNSGHRVEDHFVDVTEMVRIGKGGHRVIRSKPRLLLRRPVGPIKARLDERKAR